jgi:hypothetical protein
MLIHFWKFFVIRPLRILFSTYATIYFLIIFSRRPRPILAIVCTKYSRQFFLPCAGPRRHFSRSYLFLYTYYIRRVQRDTRLAVGKRPLGADL